MAEEKDDKELKPEPKEAEKESSDKLSTKSPKQSSSSPREKHRFATPLFIALAVLIIGICAFMAYSYVNNKDSEDQTGAEEAELTYAEGLEQYELEEGATQDDYNSQNIGKAWAYYTESNYEKTLEHLDLIVNPSEGIAPSVNELYGLALSAVGKEDEALSYHQATLELNEEYLLASVNNDPTAHYNLGLLYANAGQTDKAIENYQKFLDIYNSTPEKIEAADAEQLAIDAQLAIEELQ